MNGIINVYKEKGFTSFDVVAKLRGILKTKKIGHTGTLDPDAEGVLPVCVGKATKVCDFLTDKEKSYRATLLLGKTTDTLDVSGRVLSENEVNVTVEQAEEAIMSFVGDIMQIPPMYSALKVEGKKLYELARAGKEVERKPRPVRIISIDIIEISLPRVIFEVRCSKGTYIRTLCDDIGAKLGCGGCMEDLIRTSSGQFDIADAIRLSDIQRFADEGSIEEKLLPVDTVFEHLQRVEVKKDFAKVIYNGNKLFLNMVTSERKLSENENVRVYDHNGEFMAVYTFEPAERLLKPVKMFL